MRDYTVVTDAVREFRALVAGAVRDEITGRGPGANPGIRASRADVLARITPDGNFGVAGYPERLFHLTGGGSLNLSLVFSVPGYREESRDYTILPGATLPISAQTVLLRRTPVRLQGRVVEDTSARAPIADALVSTVGGPAPGEQTVALRTPLRFAHAAGALVRRCQLTPAGAARQLFADAPSGAQTLLLSDRVGLAVGDILRVGPAVGVEYGVVESLDALPADPNQPGRVTLTGALRRGFTAGAAAQLVTATVGGPNFQLKRNADAGDGLVLLDAAPAATALRIEQAASPLVEFAEVGALTDAEGFYRLDGVGRVAAVDLDVTAAGHMPLASPVAWTIDYGGAANRVDFRLS